MSKRFARRLVRLYPRVWRARYEDEFLALLDAREDLTWLDAIDILGAAGREWAKALAHWPTREPASDLRGLRRQTRLDLLVILISAELIDLIARVGAALLHGWAVGGSHAPQAFLQAAIAMRCALPDYFGEKRGSPVGPRERAFWCALILAAAVVAHLDAQSSSLVVDSWWARLASRPAFSVFMSLFFLMLWTPAARVRMLRYRELTDRRRRDSVPSAPLGLR